MAWFKIKSKVDVNSNKGDTIKNSQVTINSNSSDSSVLMEIYRGLGRLEGQCKCMIKDINYIKSKFEDMEDRITKLELTPRQMINSGRLR